MGIYHCSHLQEKEKREMDVKNDRQRRFTTILIATCILVILAIICYWIFNIDALSSIFTPIILGLVLTYLLSPVLKFYEYRIFAWKKSTRFRKNLCVALSLFMTFVTAIAVIVLFVLLIFPQLIKSLSELFANYESYIHNFVDLINNTVYSIKDFFTSGPVEYTPVLQYADLEKFFSDIIKDISQDQEMSISGIAEALNLLLPSIQRIGDVLYEVIKNILIAIFLSAYLLASKDLRKAQIKKFKVAFFSEKQNKTIDEVTHITSKNFSGFIKGKLIDSLIIGLMTYVLFEVFNVSDYNILNATTIGITNIVPVFGPVFGAIPVLIIVLISNPSKFLIALLLLLLIQQLDGNIIGPKILGDSTNVSSSTVIIAICTMGSILGVFGMIIGVPLFATIIAVVKSVMERRLREKGMPVETEEYFSKRALLDAERATHKEQHTWLYKYQHSQVKVRIDNFLAKIQSKPKKTKKNNNNK